MDDLEQQLKRAMARTDAPGTLESRVLAAVSRDGDERRGWWTWLAQPMRLRWATVALALVLVATGITWQRERERAQGEQAAAKVELALKITSEKLQRIDRTLATLQQ